MILIDSTSLREQSEMIYHEKLQMELEAQNYGQFVAVEPESGEFFLGNSISEAMSAGRVRFPDRLFHVIRIGFLSAVEFGYAHPERSGQ